MIHSRRLNITSLYLVLTETVNDWM
jgi:hypothetical protein